jgi:hypothetical protein
VTRPGKFASRCSAGRPLWPAFRSRVLKLSASTPAVLAAVLEYIDLAKSTVELLSCANLLACNLAVVRVGDAASFIGLAEIALEQATGGV